MTWMEFVAKIVAVGAWPAAILVIILVLRHQFKKDHHD
jgi:hypothetical protein